MNGSEESGGGAILPLSVEGPLSEDLSTRRRGLVSLTNRSRTSSGAVAASTSVAVPPSVSHQEGGDRRKDGKVSFSDSVFDLASGKQEPLQQAGKKGDFVRSMDNKWKYNAPLGYRLLEKTRFGKGLSLSANRIIVLILTFLCYMAYHASRKPPSIVKSVLHGSSQQSKGEYHDRRRLFEIFASADVVDTLQKHHHNESSDSGWEPFNNPDNGQSLLGDLDVSFLGAYALGMFVSGHLGDRLDLRKFLTWGMLGSGACVGLFGMAFFWNIHSMPYFLGIQVIGGFFQATGWPSVVTVMANWFGHGKRGLIMGVWNAHTSVGNILGSLIAASMLQYGWGWSFVVPGLLIAGVGILIYLFLVVEPQDIGFLPQSGSNLGSFAASEAGTPQRGQPLSSEDKALLERRLAIIAESRDGIVPSQVTASMKAHHHIRRPQHGMIAMGSTLVMVNDDRDSVDVRGLL